MPCCQVVWCKNRAGYFNGSYTSVFSIPDPNKSSENKLLCAQWLNYMQNPRFNIKTYTYRGSYAVCEDHFTKDSFEGWYDNSVAKSLNFESKRPKLKKGAVPTVLSLYPKEGIDVMILEAKLKDERRQMRAFRTGLAEPSQEVVERSTYNMRVSLSSIKVENSQHLLEETKPPLRAQKFGDFMLNKPTGYSTVPIPSVKVDSINQLPGETSSQLPTSEVDDEMIDTSTGYMSVPLSSIKTESSQQLPEETSPRLQEMDFGDIMEEGSTGCMPFPVSLIKVERIQQKPMETSLRLQAMDFGDITLERSTDYMSAPISSIKVESPQQLPETSPRLEFGDIMVNRTTGCNMSVQMSPVMAVNIQQLPEETNQRLQPMVFGDLVLERSTDYMSAPISSIKVESPQQLPETSPRLEFGDIMVNRTTGCNMSVQMSPVMAVNIQQLPEETSQRVQPMVFGDLVMERLTGYMPDPHSLPMVESPRHLPEETCPRLQSMEFCDNVKPKTEMIHEETDADGDDAACDVDYCSHACVLCDNKHFQVLSIMRDHTYAAAVFGATVEGLKTQEKTCYITDKHRFNHSIADLLLQQT